MDGELKNELEKLERKLFTELMPKQQEALKNYREKFYGKENFAPSLNELLKLEDEIFEIWKRIIDIRKTAAGSNRV